MFLHDAGQDKVHVFDKSHLEHLIGLVEDHGFDVGKVEAVIPYKVDEAAGRGHEHVNAVVDLGLLDVHVKAAVDGKRHHA